HASEASYLYVWRAAHDSRTASPSSTSTSRAHSCELLSDRAQNPDRPAATRSSLNPSCTFVAAVYESTSVWFTTPTNLYSVKLCCASSDNARRRGCAPGVQPEVEVGVDEPRVHGVGHRERDLVLLAVQQLAQKSRELDVVGWEVERADAGDRSPEQRVDAAGVDHGERPHDADQVAVDLNSDLAERAVSGGVPVPELVLRVVGEVHLENGTSSLISNHRPSFNGRLRDIGATTSAGPSPGCGGGGGGWRKYTASVVGSRAARSDAYLVTSLETVHSTPAPLWMGGSAVQPRRSSAPPSHTPKTRSYWTPRHVARHSRTASEITAARPPAA
ncbi:hypothetical protein ACJX0J_023751, partial [Zea mays]